MCYTSPRTVPRQVSRAGPVLCETLSFEQIREARRYLTILLRTVLLLSSSLLREVSLVGSKGNSNFKYILLLEDLLSC